MACKTVLDVELCIYAGDTFEFGLDWTDSENKPIDMRTGYTALMQARVHANVPDPPLFTKTELDGITLGDGTVDVVLSPSDTDQVSLKNVYDLQVTETSTGKNTTLIRGSMPVERDVSRLP